MSGKLLLKLNTINYILGHHTHEYFPFLDEAENTRHRTTFYATLGRLLFMDDSPKQTISESSSDLQEFRDNIPHAHTHSSP